MGTCSTAEAVTTDFGKADASQERHSISLESVPIPSSFLCPITQEVMVDPVVAVDGCVYERSGIETWFHMGHRTSPKTGLALPALTLVPEVPLRRAVEEYVALRPELLELATEHRALRVAVQSLHEEVTSASSAKKSLQVRMGEVAEDLATALDDLHLAIKQWQCQPGAESTAKELSSVMQVAERLATILDGLGPTKRTTAAEAAGKPPPQQPLDACPVRQVAAKARRKVPLLGGAPQFGGAGGKSGGVAAALGDKVAVPPLAGWAASEVAAKLEGHLHGVSSLATLGLNRLASGCLDGTVKVWEVKTRRCVATIQAHANWVSALAALGLERLASAGDKKVKIWDLPSGRCVASLEEHDGWVSSLVVLGPGRLASGSEDMSIKVWEGRQCTMTLSGHSRWVKTLAALSPDTLASGGGDADVKVWDVSSGSCLATLHGHTAPVWALAPLGLSWLASGSEDQSVKIWDLPSGVCAMTLEGHADRISSLAVLGPDLLASGSVDTTINLWEVSHGRCVATLQGHADAVWCLACQGRDRFVGGFTNGTVMIWEAKWREPPDMSSL